MDSIANHNSLIDYNQKLNRQIIHTWKTIWFPIYGEDFEGFCRFVLKIFNVDISKEFYLTYDYELILKPRIKTSKIPLPPKKDIKEKVNDLPIDQKTTPRNESPQSSTAKPESQSPLTKLELRRPRRLSSIQSDNDRQIQKRWQ